MKKGLLLFFGALTLVFQNATAQRKCGMQQVHEALIASDPTWKQKLDNQRASLEAAANYYLQVKANEAANPDAKTTTTSAIPVVFHIIVDSAQFYVLGGTTGIIKRCDSAIAVLNADFNRQNSDSTMIPSSWKALYANTGIHFGLARTSPTGHCSPGYEIKIITPSATVDSGFSDESAAFATAKTAGTGLASWDVTKYYNVWCINFTGAAVGLLGLTAPKSSCGTGGYPTNQEGVCILYNTLGSTGSTGTCAGTGEWPTPYNLGRTLTHETGHFFEIWHPWGDDGGQCPTWSSTATATGSGLPSGSGGLTCTSGTGFDDGLSDTPPESDAVYGNPTYTISGGTTTDCCKMHGSTNTQPIGIACLSYMDYTDDNAMHMFTTMQGAAMASMVLTPSTGGAGATGYGMVGENYSLSQNPALLLCPTGISEQSLEARSSLSIYPNPTTGQIIISVNSAVETLNQITIVDLLGNTVATTTGENKDYYTLNLAGLSKGIYIIKCNFATGTVTRKIILE